MLLYLCLIFSLQMFAYTYLYAVPIFIIIFLKLLDLGSICLVIPPASSPPLSPNPPFRSPVHPRFQSVTPKGRHMPSLTRKICSDFFGCPIGSSRGTMGPFHITAMYCGFEEGPCLGHHDTERRQSLGRLYD